MIFVNFQIKAGPWGGGNQFLRGLKSYLSKDALLDERVTKRTRVILVNSHHSPGYTAYLILVHRYIDRKKIVFRVDGPVEIIRGGYRSKLIDLYCTLAFGLVDGIIFQSNFSLQQFVSSGFDVTGKNIQVILNQADPEIFFDQNLPRENKIVCTSWSNNYDRKGFDILHSIDMNFPDIAKEIVFIGNSPVDFVNITVIGPVNSRELANKLNTFKYYLTVSKNDPCSNSLVEAIGCGCIPVIRRSGGHVELAKTSVHHAFDSVSELVNLIEQLITNRASGDPERNGKLGQHVQEQRYVEYKRFFEIVEMNSRRAPIAEFAAFSKFCIAALLLKL